MAIEQTQTALRSPVLAATTPINTQEDLEQRAAAEAETNAEVDNSNYGSSAANREEGTNYATVANPPTQGRKAGVEEEELAIREEAELEEEEETRVGGRRESQEGESESQEGGSESQEGGLEFQERGLESQERGLESREKEADFQADSWQRGKGAGPTDQEESGLEEEETAQVNEERSKTRGKRKGKEGAAGARKARRVSAHTGPSKAIAMETTTEVGDKEDKDNEASRRRASQWLLEQICESDDPIIRKTTPEVQKQIVKEALSVANAECIARWHMIIHSWRNKEVFLLSAAVLAGVPQRSGSASPHPSSSSSVAAPSIQKVQDSMQRFSEIYKQTQKQDVAQELVPIVRRYTLATLYRAYRSAIAQIEAKSSRKTRGNESEASRALFRISYPEYAQIGDPAKNARRQWSAFQTKISRAKQMWLIEGTLGCGVWSLLSAQTTDRFLTNTLRAGYATLWIELVRRFNQRYLQVSESVTLLTKRAFSTGQLLDDLPQQQRYRIEYVNEKEAKAARQPGELFEVVNAFTQDRVCPTPEGSRPNTSSQGADPDAASPHFGNAWDFIGQGLSDYRYDGYSEELLDVGSG